jgi:hypothetical protein
LLQYWAYEQQSAGQSQQAHQIELRRQLLRQIAAEQIMARVAEATEQEQEFRRTGKISALDSALATRRYVVHDPKAPFVAAESGRPTSRH